MKLIELARELDAPEGPALRDWIARSGNTRRQIAQNTLEYVCARGFNGMTFLKQFSRSIVAPGLWREASSASRGIGKEVAQLAVDLTILVDLRNPGSAAVVSGWCGGGSLSAIYRYVCDDLPLHTQRLVILLSRDSAGAAADRYLENLEHGAAFAVPEDISGSAAWLAASRELAFRLARVGAEKAIFQSILRFFRRVGRHCGDHRAMIPGCRMVAIMLDGESGIRALHSFERITSLSPEISMDLVAALLGLKERKIVPTVDWISNSALIELNPTTTGRKVLIDLAVLLGASEMPQPFQKGTLTHALFQSLTRLAHVDTSVQGWLLATEYAIHQFRSERAAILLLSALLWEVLMRTTQGNLSIRPPDSWKTTRRLVDEALGKRAGQERTAAFRGLCEYVIREEWRRFLLNRDNTHVTLDRFWTVAAETGCYDDITETFTVLNPNIAGRYLSWCREQKENGNRDLSVKAFSRITLEQALPFVQEAIIPMVGLVPVFPAEWASTDGNVIRLPAAIDFFPDHPDFLSINRNITMYVFLALHEAGHLTGASFRYDTTPYALSKSYPRLFHECFNYVEDYRIEQLLRITFAGEAVDQIMDFGRRYFLWTADPRDSKSVLIHYCLDVLWFGNERYQKDRAWHEAVDLLLRDRSRAAGDASCTAAAAARILRAMLNMDVQNPLASLTVAEKLYRLLIDWHSPDALELLQLDVLEAEYRNARDRHEEGQPIPVTPEMAEALYAEANENPTARLNTMTEEEFCKLMSEETAARSMRSQIEFIDGMKKTVADIEAAHIRKQTDTNPFRNAIKRITSGKKKKNGSGKRAEATRRAGHTSAPDSVRIGLRHDEISEVDLTRVDPDFLNKHREYAAVRSQIETCLREMILAEEPADLRAHEFGTQLDTETVTHLMADYEAYASRPVFLEQIPGDRDTVVYLGIDVSGSTSARAESDDGSSENKTVIDIEKHFALLFYDALESIRITPKVAAFESMTSTNVYWIRNRDAISGLIPGQANRDGDFIRYITRVMKPERASKKFFFLLSDGRPSASNYDGDSAIDDTRQAMVDAVRAGIQLVYINVDSPENPYYRTFADAATAAIQCQSPGELPHLVPHIMRQVVRGTAGR